MDEPASTRELRTFGLLVGGIFAIIGIWPLVLRGDAPRYWSAAVGAVLFALGVVFPSALRQVHAVWMKIGHVLGWINTRILLGVVFFGLITPMGTVMRWARKDSMRRVLVHDAESYRVVRRPRDRAHMKNQF